MLEYFQITGEKIKEVTKPVKHGWVNAVSPTLGELQELQKLVPVESDLLNELQDIDEIPMISRNRNFVFIILRTPQKNPGNQDLEYSTIPLGIIISSNYFITISSMKNDVIESFKTMLLAFKGMQPVLKLFLATSEMYMSYLKQINKKIYSIQGKLEQTASNKGVLRLLSLEKSLVYFRTSLKSNEFLFERFARNGDFIHLKENKELMAEVLDENRQAIEMTRIYSTILSGMMNALSYIISNNLNTVIKLLTSVTVILMIPTLVASLYGMNVALPFEDSPNAFFIIVIFTLLFSIIGVLAVKLSDKQPTTL
ncbi:MAG: magnesium transporter CorA family protein [Nanoarchaeota archaeon]|nr:magnesium transporter CorA family protein [Nanoarchaeota archaeon]